MGPPCLGLPTSPGTLPFTRVEWGAPENMERQGQLHLEPGALGGEKLCEPHWAEPLTRTAQAWAGAGLGLHRLGGSTPAQ